MNTNEKILLVQLLLEDIRGDWSHDCGKRASKANSLCKEIARESHNDEFLILADFCDTYIKIGRQHDDWDGRMFRQPFPMGYENMSKLHGLKPTIKNKSNDFQTVVRDHFVNPENRFTDWES